MTLSLYQISVPVFLRGFANLSAILSKGQAYAEAKKIDPSVLITARLAPDMFPLSRQVQIATDVTKGGLARLAGIEIPSYPDNEASFAELQQRISRTVAFVQSITPQQIDNSGNKPISLKAGGRDLHFEGQPYLLQFVLPNFYFHITATYAILRHNGVDIGKADYLGAW